MTHTPKHLYAVLASKIVALANCRERQAIARDENACEWIDKHAYAIDQLVKDFMPSGSGFDNGTKIDLDASTADKLTFSTAFHHMSEHGYYDGWTKHAVIVTPTFGDIAIRVTGRNRNEIKEHIHETFCYALSLRVVWSDAAERYVYAAELQTEMDARAIEAHEQDEIAAALSPNVTEGV